MLCFYSSMLITKLENFKKEIKHYKQHMTNNAWFDIYFFRFPPFFKLNFEEEKK